MADFETNFDGAENNSLEIVLYQFEPILLISSANIITETSSFEDETSSSEKMSARKKNIQVDELEIPTGECSGVASGRTKNFQRKNE